jgi:hypothetical protein
VLGLIRNGSVMLTLDRELVVQAGDALVTVTARD